MRETRLLNIPEYLQLEREELNWIVPGLLAKPSTTLILGGPKAGKSYLALALALAIAHGQPVLGRESKPCRVLLLQFDTSHGVWAEMISKVAEEGHRIDGEIYHVHPADMPHPPNILLPPVQEFIRGILENLQPDVVIVDVFRKIHTAGENDSQQMTVVDHVLGMLFHDVALVLLHHAKKLYPDQAEVGPVEASRGSSHIAAIADFIWYLAANKLMIVPRMGEQLSFGMKRLASGLWSLDGRSTEEDIRTRLMDICLTCPGLTKGAVFDRCREEILALGVSRPTFYRMLDGEFTAGVPAAIE